MEDKARFVAVSTLFDIDQKKAYSNIRLGEYFKKYDLTPMDRAFASEILYGTIRWRIKIDYLIKKFSKTKLRDMNKWTLNSIRAAIYQIYFMDKVPEFAAVNQAVEITKIRDKRATAFVNGVLRNILRNKEEFYNIKEKDKIKRYSIEYSHPEWMVQKFISSFGEDFSKKLMEANNIPPEMNIRVNTLKLTRDELVHVMEEKGVEVKKSFVEEGLKLRGFNMIEKSEEMSNGLMTVQDESSMLVAKILDPKPDEKIIDLCSAPGGKTTHIAQIMNNKGEITAFDVHGHKLKLVNENAERLGINIIKTKLQDASEYLNDYADYADRVLIDAPCSGIGLMRKKPEIRWNITEKDIYTLQELQYAIIKNGARYVKKGGILVYSTCTITREEDEEILKRFLMEHNNFEVEDICSLTPEEIRSDTCGKGYIKLFPNAHGTDGFFISKLIRKW